MTITKLPTAMTQSWREAVNALIDEGADPLIAEYMVRRLADFQTRFPDFVPVEGPKGCSDAMDRVGAAYGPLLECYQLEVVYLLIELWHRGAR